MTHSISYAVTLIAAAYALGSVPVGVVLTRCFSSEDIRQAGSGNIGATNVSRVAGVRLGLTTLLLDALKGAGPVLAAMFLIPGTTDWLVILAGLAAFLGHLYPLYTKLRGGGKGVATAAGVFLAAVPAACLTAVLVFILTVLAFRRVSAGSLAAALALPAGVWFLSFSPAYFFGACCVAALVIWRHRQNIQRLLRGTEPPFFGGSSG
ncbi:MAG: glycerol-3-phosphate 1-O-acyltransferase PlsY [Desulfosudaceae bacterium]